MDFIQQKFFQLVFLSIVMVLLCACDGQAGAQEEFVVPTIVPADGLTPAPRPADNREVAILTLVITSSDDGQVENVQLEEAKVISSFAPNVLGRSGPWTIELVGDEETRYGTLDPREQRVYEDQTDQPHSTELSRQITWETVVPLFDGAQDLNVRLINIYDQDGTMVFSTEVDREAWRQQ